MRATVHKSLRKGWVVKLGGVAAVLPRSYAGGEEALKKGQVLPRGLSPAIYTLYVH